MKNEVLRIASVDQISEAMESLAYVVIGECTGNQFDFLPAIALAIDALKKQIPVEPHGKHTDYVCPMCGRRVRSGKGSSSRIRDNYCQRCGQALWWREWSKE